MIIKLLSIITITITIIFLLFGCSDADLDDMTYSEITKDEANQRDKTKYLAYEHSITIEIEKSKLQSKYKNILYVCSHNKENKCTILETSISIGEIFGEAKIRLRIKPEGIDVISKIASKNGKLKNQSTKVDDLAKEIIDVEKRIKMLTTHRDRLTKLERINSIDIESLLKIFKELASVQSQLEYSTGKEQHLLQRTKMDILTITYETTRDHSFWPPIARAFGNFSYELSDGISEVISMLAYVIPFFLAFISLFFLSKKLWKKIK